MSKVMEIQTSANPAVSWPTDDLENIYMLLFRFLGNGFWLALCNMGWLVTQKFVILEPDPVIFAPWSVLLDRGEPCVTAVKTRHALWCCVSLVPRPTTSPPEGRSRRDNEVPDPPGSCDATTMAGAREARFMVVTLQSFLFVSKCVFTV